MQRCCPLLFVWSLVVVNKCCCWRCGCGPVFSWSLNWNSLVNYCVFGHPSCCFRLVSCARYFQFCFCWRVICFPSCCFGIGLCTGLYICFNIDFNIAGRRCSLNSSWLTRRSSGYMPWIMCELVLVFEVKIDFTRISMYWLFSVHPNFLNVFSFWPFVSINQLMK